MSQKKTIRELAFDVIKNSRKIEEEFIQTGSDRACIIVSAAMLDDIVELLLKTYFPNNAPVKKDDRLFENSGPLSTSNAKIELAYRLGLVSIVEYKLLNTIRDIRNKFAHVTNIDYSSIRDKVIGVLTINDQLWFKLKLERDDEVLPEIPSDNPWKKEYIKCVLWVKDALFSRIMHAYHISPEPVIPYESALDTQDFLYDSYQRWITRRKTEKQELFESLNLLHEKQKDKMAIISDIKERISEYEQHITSGEQTLTVIKGVKNGLYKKMKEAGFLDDDE